MSAVNERSSNNKEEMKPSTSAGVVAQPKPPTYEDVELTIKRLQAQLPPITYKTESDDDSDNEVDLPRCTCTLREVVDGVAGGDDAANKQATSNATGGSVPSIEINIVKDSDEELAEAQARERLKGKKRKREKAAMKSIFDLEDEASGGEDSSDDDMEPVPDANDPVISVLVAHEQQPSSSAQPSAALLSSHPNAAAAPLADGTDDFATLEMPKPPVYEAVIDPNCPAMQFYETNRNQVTNYHVEALHNYYVANVNGNWNQVKASKAEAGEDNDGDDAEAVSVDTANRVVPRYNFLRCDKMPKQFFDFHFDYKSYLEHRRRERYDKRKAKRRLFSSASDATTIHENNNEFDAVTTATAAATNHMALDHSEDEEMMQTETDTADINHTSPQHVEENGILGEHTTTNGHDDELSPPPPPSSSSQNVDVGDAEMDVVEEEEIEDQQPLEDGNNGKLPSFNELQDENVTGHRVSDDLDFNEWYRVATAVSNDENLTILPYVIID